MNTEETPNNKEHNMLRQSLSTMSLQVLFTLLAFGTSVLMAQWAGAVELGRYVGVMAWTSLCTLIAISGADDLMLRETARAEKVEETTELTYFAMSQHIFSSLLATALLLFVWLTGIGGVSGWLWLWSPVIIVLAAGMNIWQAALRGVGEMSNGQVPEKILKPIVILLCLGITVAIVGVGNVSAGSLLMGQMVGFLVAAFLSWYYWSDYVDTDIEANEEEPEKWAEACRWFLYMTVLQSLALRQDMLWLTYFAKEEPAQMAYYNAALRFSELLTIPITVAFTVAAPVFSRLFDDGNLQNLWSTYLKVTLAQFVLTLIGAVFIWFFGPWILGWYGADFVQPAYELMVILCLGQVLFSLFGPMNYLLMMSGNEKSATFALAISVILTAILQYRMTDMFGTVGTAWATVGGMLFQQLLMWAMWLRRGQGK